MSKLDELERLAELREKGALTEAEFEREKARVMNGTMVDPRNLTTCPNCIGVTFPRNGSCPNCGFRVGDVKKGFPWGRFIAVLFALYVLTWPVSSPSWVWLVPSSLTVAICSWILKRGVAGRRRWITVAIVAYAGLFGVIGLWSVVTHRIDEADKAEEHEAKKRRGAKLKKEFRTAIDSGDVDLAAKRLATLSSEFSGSPTLTELREELSAARAQKAKELDAAIRNALGSNDWDAARTACDSAKTLPADTQRDQLCSVADAGQAVADKDYPAAWKACRGADADTGADVCEQAATGLLALRAPLIAAAVEGEKWAAGRIPCEELGELVERQSAVKTACAKIMRKDDAEKAAAAHERRTAKVEAWTEAVLAVVNDKKTCDTPKDVLRVWNDINSVTKEDPGYRQARNAVRKLERCRKQMERTLGNGVRQLMRTQRESHVKELDRLFLDQGMDVTVRALGKNKTTLKMTYALFSRAWAYKLTDGGSMSDPSMLFNAQKIGFKKVVFADGYRESYTYTLDPQDESKAGVQALPYGLKETLKL